MNAIRLLAMLAMLACLILDQHVISKQDKEIAMLLQSMGGAHKSMTEAREALQAQGNALEACMHVVDPKWKRPAAASTTAPLTGVFRLLSRPPMTTTGTITLHTEPTR